MNTPQFLRKQMELVWNTPGVLFPSHVVVWSNKNSPSCMVHHATDLFYRKGRKASAPSLRRIKKGTINVRH